MIVIFSTTQPKSKRDFETHLRAEIFRWLAPEIFSDQTPSEATDVYGLSLLIWEMTTSEFQIFYKISENNFV